MLSCYCPDESSSSGVIEDDPIVSTKRGNIAQLISNISLRRTLYSITILNNYQTFRYNSLDHLSFFNPSSPANITTLSPFIFTDSRSTPIQPPPSNHPPTEISRLRRILLPLSSELLTCVVHQVTSTSGRVPTVESIKPHSSLCEVEEQDCTVVPNRQGR